MSAIPGMLCIMLHGRNAGQLSYDWANVHLVSDEINVSEDQNLPCGINDTSPGERGIQSRLNKQGLFKLIK